MGKKIKKNDKVIVITGKNKGKRGKVERIFSNGKVIVKGINLVKKHRKPVPNLNKSGGIFEEESKIDISNIAIFNESMNKIDKISFKLHNGKKVRIFKSSGELIK